LGDTLDLQGSGPTKTRQFVAATSGRNLILIEDAFANSTTINFSIQDTCSGSNCAVPLFGHDISGDVKADLILYDQANGNEYTAISSGTGFFNYVFSQYTPGFDSIRLGDWNGDGRADILVYNSTTALAYIGLSDGSGRFNFSSLFWPPGFNK